MEEYLRRHKEMDEADEYAKQIPIDDAEDDDDDDVSEDKFWRAHQTRREANHPQPRPPATATATRPTTSTTARRQRLHSGERVTSPSMVAPSSSSAATSASSSSYSTRQTLPESEDDVRDRLAAIMNSNAALPKMGAERQRQQPQRPHTAGHARSIPRQSASGDNDVPSSIHDTQPQRQTHEEEEEQRIAQGETSRDDEDVWRPQSALSRRHNYALSVAAAGIVAENDNRKERSGDLCGEQRKATALLVPSTTCVAKENNTQVAPTSRPSTAGTARHEAASASAGSAADHGKRNEENKSKKEIAVTAAVKKPQRPRTAAAATNERGVTSSTRVAFSRLQQQQQQQQRDVVSSALHRRTQLNSMNVAQKKTANSASEEVEKAAKPKRLLNWRPATASKRKKPLTPAQEAARLKKLENQKLAAQQREAFEQREEAGKRCYAANVIGLWWDAAKRGVVQRQHNRLLALAREAQRQAAARRAYVRHRWKFAVKRVIWMGGSGILRNKAALIQALFRGFMERRHVKTLELLRATKKEATRCKMLVERRHYAARVVQRAWRLTRFRRAIGHYLCAFRSHQATLIQRCYRGHAYAEERKSVAAAVASRHNEAASRIQRAWFRYALDGGGARLEVFRRKQFPNMNWRSFPGSQRRANKKGTKGSESSS